jgi:hypothetical protein
MNTKIITGVKAVFYGNASGQKRVKSEASRQSGRIQNRRVNIQKTPKFSMSHNIKYDIKIAEK